MKTILKIILVLCVTLAAGAWLRSLGHNKTASTVSSVSSRAVWTPQPPAPQPAPPEPTRPILTPDQQKALTKIKTAIHNLTGPDNVFHSVTWEGSVAQASVGRPFYALPYDDKTRIIQGILTYGRSLDPDCSGVILVDAYTNHRAGTYTDETGLQLK